VETWLIVFIGIVAIAVLLQATVLLALFITVRRTAQRVEQLSNELHERALPLLSKVTLLIEDVQPRISGMFSDAAEISTLARVQVQRVDRVLAEAAERLRMQLVHADQILTGALDSVEDTSAQIRRSIVTPLQSVIAVVRGVQTGIEFYRSGGARRSSPAEAANETQDETLFI
jgi:hypothetical protein